MNAHTFAIIRSFLLAIVFGAAVVITGCDDQGPAEEAGEKVDETVEDAGEALEDAGEEAEDAAEDLEDDNGN